LAENLGAPSQFGDLALEPAISAAQFGGNRPFTGIDLGRTPPPETSEASVVASNKR
jgi:hypothetical protein